MMARAKKPLTSGDVASVSDKLDESRSGTVEGLLGTATKMLGDGNFPVGIDVED